jgi:hypothetical protein
MIHSATGNIIDRSLLTLLLFAVLSTAFSSKRSVPPLLCSFLHIGPHSFYLCLSVCLLRPLHCFLCLPVLPHSPLPKRTVPSSIVCVAKQRQLDDGREGVKDLLQRNFVAFRDSSKGEEFLACFCYVDNSIRVSVKDIGRRRGERGYRQIW